jgi:3-carboxy-cis,cis-muconate cycloisomerase
MLAPRLGRLAAHDLVAEAAARSAGTGRPFRDELLSAAGTELASTGRASASADPGPGPGAGDGITAEEIDAALDPSGYLGASGEFVRRALAAHEDTERALARRAS